MKIHASGENHLSHYNNIRSSHRLSMSLETVNDRLAISLNGAGTAHFDPRPCVAEFLIAKETYWSVRSGHLCKSLLCKQILSYWWSIVARGGKSCFFGKPQKNKKVWFFGFLFLLSLQNINCFYYYISSKFHYQFQFWQFKCMIITDNYSGLNNVGALLCWCAIIIMWSTITI